MWADYAEDLPFFERWWKQVRHGAWWLYQFLSNGKKPPAVYVWPEMPSRRAALTKITRELGWELTNRPRHSALLGIRFEDITHKPLTSVPAEMQSGILWWNVHCEDISKKAVENQHVSAFGYGMAVDPLTHNGPMVCKSDANAMHDGEVLEGPIESEDVSETAVYQRVIDNRDEQDRYFDYRAVYIQGEIVLVYRKFKHPLHRFTNETVSVDLLNTLPFSETECASIAAMASGMGIDYAELDALRDRSSGRLFVVDVNPTPWGPPAQLAAEFQNEAVKRMAQAFSASVQLSFKNDRKAP